MRTSIVTTRRRTGKVARLPWKTREELNVMLRDGKPYQEILKWLQDQGHGELTRWDLTSWSQGGYPEWEARQRSLQDEYDWAKSWCRGDEGRVFQEAGLGLMIRQFQRLFSRLDWLQFEQQLSHEPGNCLRMANTFARLSQCLLQLEQFKVVEKDQKREVARNPQISPEEKIRRLKQIYGLEDRMTEEEERNAVRIERQKRGLPPDGPATPENGSGSGSGSGTQKPEANIPVPPDPVSDALMMSGKEPEEEPEAKPERQKEDEGVVEDAEGAEGPRKPGEQVRARKCSEVQSSAVKCNEQQRQPAGQPAPAGRLKANPTKSNLDAQESGDEGLGKCPMTNVP